MSRVDRDLVRLSKRLSYVLRHHPASAGLTLDEQGWVAVDELLAGLSATGAPVSRVQLDAVVAGNDKQRFALRPGPDGRERIRASQGHSVPVDLGLVGRTPPDVLFHGTSEQAVPAILRDGLRRQARHHVHLSVDVPTARRVGSRRPGAVVVLRVDAAAMAADGYEFLRSDNGVWLTAYVPAAYLSRGPAG